MRGFTATASLSEAVRDAAATGCGGSRRAGAHDRLSVGAAAAERVTMEARAAALRDQRGQVIAGAGATGMRAQRSTTRGCDGGDHIFMECSLGQRSGVARGALARLEAPARAGGRCMRAARAARGPRSRPRALPVEHDLVENRFPPRIKCGAGFVSGSCLRARACTIAKCTRTGWTFPAR